ncbi:MAG: hypothetical protein ACR2G1_07320 [Rubrobacteraceae bacterium]
MKQLRFSAIWLAASLVCLATLVVVASLGLAVPVEIVLPLALMFGAMMSALAASWSANAWIYDGSRSRLLVIVGWTEAAAVPLTIAFTAMAFFGAPNVGLIFILLSFTVTVSLCATVAALRLRSAVGNLQRDATISLMLFAAGIVTILLVLAPTCSLTGCVA